jgi:ADP-heptose:LPS heptosyltransferase
VLPATGPVFAAASALMTPDRLRRLDRLLGVPLCFLLTAARNVAPVFRPRPPADAPARNVLFVQLAEAGSMVLADPAVRAVEARGALPWFVTFVHNAPALALTGTLPADRVFTLRSECLATLAVDTWRLRRWAKRNGIDAVVDLELFSRLTAVLAFWIGAPRRAGFHAEEGGALYRGRLFSAPVRFNPHQHMARNYLRLVITLLDGAAAARSLDEAIVILRKRPPTAAALACVARLFAELPAPAGRLVLINPNASDRLPQRRWPGERFADLIEQLLAVRPDLSVALIGGEEDRAATAAVIARVGAIGRSRCIDLAGRLAIDALPALFARSALLVSNDSGPAHFAAVSGLPVVVLFGPETPTLFGPLGPATIISAGLACSPCVSPANQRKSSCRDNQCMQAIDVATVLDASLQVLARRAVRSATPVQPLRKVAR